jgi:hypothetical protein
MQGGGLGFGPDGNLYAGGTGGSAGNIYRINPSTGASTLVGATGFNPSGITGLALYPGVISFPQTPVPPSLLLMLIGLAAVGVFFTWRTRMHTPRPGN